MRQVLVTISIAFLAVCAKAQTPFDEHTIVMKALERLVRVNRPDLRFGFLVAMSTTPDLAPEASTHPAIAGLGEAWADYRTRNTAQLSIEPIPDLPSMKVVNISRKATAYDWREINNDFPGMHLIVDISRPGFEDGGRTAVVRADVISATGPTTEIVFVFHLSQSGWTETGSYFPVGRPATPN